MTYRQRIAMIQYPVMSETVQHHSGCLAVVRDKLRLRPSFSFGFDADSGLPPNTIYNAPGHTAATSDPITITVPAPSPTNSSLTVSPDSVVAGGTSTITVTARDSGGHPITGLGVVISVTGSGNTVTQPSALTDGNGEATGTVSSTLAETKTVSVRIDTVDVVQTASIAVVPGPPAAGSGRSRSASNSGSKRSTRSTG